MDKKQAEKKFNYLYKAAHSYGKFRGQSELKRLEYCQKMRQYVKDNYDLLISK